MKQLSLAALLAVVLTAGVTLARSPVRNVSAAGHPNLAAAQKLVAQAYDKVTAAQKANEFDIDGHAQRAKDLLDQASQELKAAAESSNDTSAAK